MYKILVVDDELLVRTGIKSLIKWEEHGFEIVGEAQDGIEAIELCKLFYPDIIITDILMPRMNGIELIEQAKRLNENCRIIVLSCHNDFEYVKRALKQGAEDYLLKLSMKPNDLLAVLNETKHNMFKSGLHPQSGLQTPNHTLHTLTSRHTLNVKEPLVAVLFKFDLINFEIGDDSRTTIRNFIDQYVRGKHTYDISIEHDGKILLCTNMIEIDALVQEMTLLLNTIKRLFDVSLSVGISCQKEHESRALAVQEAQTALDESYYQGVGSIICYEESEIPQNESDYLPPQVVCDLRQEIQANNLPAIQLITHDILTNLHSKKAPVRITSQVVIEILHMCKNAFDVYHLDFNAITQDQGPIFVKAIGFEFFEQLRNWFERFIESFCSILKHELTTRYSSDIQEAINYIHTNFTLNITLRAVSDHLHLSENYFCGKFKKQTGISFVSYLNLIRIEHAKELLLSSEDPAYIIANSVGFENTNYFSRLFKQLIGVSPTHYRKSMKHHDRYCRE